MSASLVGSEMCIRDRKWCGQRTDLKRLAPTSPTCKYATDWNVMWSTPVSYTHLTLPTICSV
eukprot:4261161-Alexandrium_andersonii.AAC.1